MENVENIATCMHDEQKRGLGLFKRVSLKRDDIGLANLTSKPRIRHFSVLQRNKIVKKTQVQTVLHIQMM